MMHSRFTAPLVAWTILVSAAVAQPPNKIDFAKDVQPIFAAACYKCHGETRSESSFRLDRKADALKGGDIGKAIVPGKSSESPLVRYVSGTDKLKMPPKGDRLTAEQIATLRAWIDQGPDWAESGSAVAAKDHWA